MAFREIVSDGGCRIILYSTNGGGDKPIHGAYYTGSKEWGWIPTSWDKDGRRASSHSSDLDIIKAVNEGKVPFQKEKQESREVQVEVGDAIRALRDAERTENPV